MKKLIIGLAIVLLASVSTAQYQRDLYFVPQTLSGATAMSSRTYSLTYDDTTQAIGLDGVNRAFVHLISAANDSISVIVSYSTSADGSTFSAYTVLDSLSTTGTVGAVTGLELPAKAMAAHQVRIRVYASPINRVSGSPATTITTRIRLKRR